MATYLFTWNPAKWAWDELDDDVIAYRAQGFFDGRWSCGRTKKIKEGDRAFLMRLGAKKPFGIMASGECVSEPIVRTHFSDPSKTTLSVNLRYDVLLHPFKEAILSKDILLSEIPSMIWTPQGSGITIPPAAAAALEDLWAAHLASVGLLQASFPEEVGTPERFFEGALRRITVDAYERDPRARTLCIKHYGAECQVCGFNFETQYGDIGKDFIHVHHLTPLADIGETYEVDPIRDLLPVCANCHAMIHRRKPTLSPSQLRKRIKC
jgi:5-methylcytosine-specific restriction protein A